MKMGAVVAACAYCAVTVVVGQESHLINTHEKTDSLIRALYRESWPGAESHCVPVCWDFHFTAPMRNLLDIGQEAQPRLLLMLPDVEIQDQVIILLGGVGDERAIGPIITAMKSALAWPLSDMRKRTLTAGNLALTNITAAEVIWHHGGGIPIQACPKDPAGCWSAWWEQRKETFRVKEIKVSRRYSNYPNYGIYRGLP